MQRVELHDSLTLTEMMDDDGHNLLLHLVRQFIYILVVVGRHVKEKEELKDTEQQKRITEHIHRKKFENFGQSGHQ